MTELIAQSVSYSSLEAAYLATMRDRIVRSEIWLRMVARGEIPITGADEGAGTPTYTAPGEREPRPARAL